ncbi:MAG: SUMF1/EgtB/PvdO family nonheme iron enzyme [Gemmatimonadetes bacterium]|nr:SUMF1/EgtB/PvdO family nonheme iron enzyme [Gemmatimonadota bacterium]
MTADPLFERLSHTLAGRYTLLRELGHGGMATVYLAVDVKLGREVAIKVLPPATRDFLGADRFQREVHLVAQLSHPHIVPLFEAGEADGILFYVMEYVEGESLQEKLGRDGQLSLDEALRITAEVGDALQYAHERGIIHRDIKPANILLSRGHALVADFGIAKLAAASSGGDTLTATGMSVGTAEYMSPEQAGGEKRIDARTDIYALAAVLYEMLVGEPPFTGPTVQAIVARVIADPPRPIRTIRPTVPPHIERALLAALSKVPADRPESAKAFVDLLTRPTAERPAGRGPRRRRIAAGVALLALAAAVWGVTATIRKPKPPPPPARPAGMLVVPAGVYRVGGGAGRPAAAITLDSFYIDSTEVSVGAYRRFLDSTHVPAPWSALPADIWPVTGVLWVEADEYCRWREPGGRLPSEDEWEAAARGAAGWRYPWGDAWQSGRANAARVSDTLAPVGRFRLGRSPVGAVDLVGNAWEWTVTEGPRGTLGVTHLIKGGAFDTPQELATAVHRAAMPDDRRAVGKTGFRCARDPRP